MTDRRAALDEVHQSMHEEYHGTMRREDIIRLAREAGASSLHGGETALFGDAAIERFAELVIEHDRETWMGGPAMRQFADLVAAAEREACAKVCEAEQFELTQDVAGKNGLQHFDAGCRSCAEMIRARGEK